MTLKLGTQTITTVPLRRRDDGDALWETRPGELALIDLVQEGGSGV